MLNNEFIIELQKLRESSKNAVAQGSSYSLDNFQEYLHIERQVERKLSEQIIEFSNSKYASLILVCGNVGDGKSHILSHLNGKLKTEIANYKIHNDATESHNPKETSNDTLNRVLTDFKDVNLKISTKKLILAINLGTLSNFLEEHSSSYGQLKEYVIDNKIIDTEIIEANEKNKSTFFHHVNFTDYHMYSLTATGPKSKIITTLLERLVADEPENSIYKAYQKIKKEDWIVNCPIVYNYEFLMNVDNREALMNLIVQSIVKNKEIVSVRSLLNFFYDLLIPIGLNWDNKTTYKDQLRVMNEAEYLSHLLPNYLFEHPELSKLFLTIEKLDPCKYRYEGLDASLIKLINSETPSNIFKEFIGEEIVKGLEGKIDKGVGNDKKKLKPEILTKLFIRLNFFGKRKSIAHLSDPYFEEFIKDLYYFNNNKMSEIKKAYNLVQEAARRWYGDPRKKNKVVLILGKNQSKYRVLKDFKVKPIPSDKSENNDVVLTTFTQNFNLTFEIEDIKEPIRIEVDFGLYDILKRILNGYRPNKKDNNNHISFVNFINKLINQNNNTAALEIDKVNIGKAADYELIKDHFGEYKFRAL
jgi:DNA phosphorothioation-dependent restriction protein DptF